LNPKLQDFIPILLLLRGKYKRTVAVFTRQRYIKISEIWAIIAE
jgi:hypothetical protein